MRKYNGRMKVAHNAITTALSAALISVCFSAAANVSQAPLSLSEGVPPNMIFTLDDSTSMAWAYIPDNPDGGLNTRRAKSAHSNPMYYDPSVTYTVPPSFNSSGVEQTLSTSFIKAYTNGFTQNTDTRDLRSDYRPTSGHNIPGGNHNYSENPASDFSVTASIASNNRYADRTTSAGIQFRIRRGGSQSNYSCEILNSELANITPDCTRAPGTSTYTASLTSKPVPAYYYTFDATLTECTGTASSKINNEGCYRLNWVTSNSGPGGVDELQNFAIWYSFYRTRALATLSAASLAFYNLSPSIRLTWQSLIHCTTLNGTACNDNRFRAFSSSQKGNFYSWLQTGTKFTVAGGTPLRSAMIRAGEFLKGSTPWENTPNGLGNNAANTHACRPSYHILMTDGMWNSNTGRENPSLSQPSRHDNTTFSLPDSAGQYDKQLPYYDANGWGNDANYTLADYAMNYWATDLRPGLDNKIRAHIPFKSGDDTTDFWDPRNNPATWQHMVNFTMGLGLSRALTKNNIPWEGNTFSGTGYNALKSGTADWPQTVPAGNGDEANVYDLWHAAINSRGEFFSVDSPDAMVQAFADILERIADRKSTASKPAVNSSMEDDGSGTNFVRYLYQTSYASDENWAGDLKRIKREQPAGAAEAITELWSAQERLDKKPPSERNIKIATSTGTGLQDFKWDNIKSGVGSPGALAQLLSVNPETGSLENNSAQGRLNFIRGSRAGEGTTYRQRVHVLGDMYSSTPAVVSGPRYLESFGNRLEGNTAYTTFINKITDRTNRNPEARQPRPPQVYVGGNDGMLHAFDAGSGAETFAFIPTAVFPKLNKLTGKNYSHEFYVDGSPVVADVYFGSEWRTILVGTLRAGGKSIFALDITTPGSEKLLWEFDESDITGANAVKPGYSFSKPTIARLHNGRWAVVTGNGYESANNANGKAALYIIDAQTGALVKSLEVQGELGISNGLSTPRLADYNNDGIADYAYAGDLQGNMWRFDLLGSNASPTRTDGGNIYGNDKSNADRFSVSYGGSPLFKATSTLGSARQPITAPPSLIRHPTREGYLVVFGTGKYFETTDKDGVKSHAQSVYGIWDNQTKAQPTSAQTISRSDLVAQQITTSVTATAPDGSTTTARTITDNPITWLKEDGSLNKRGWYLDLRAGASPFNGEMMIEDMSALGQTIFFQTLIPNDDPCDSGASNWTYAINPFTGGKTRHHAFDYRGANDGIVSGIQQAGEGGFSISTTPDGQYDLSTGNETIRIYADPASIGRQSWRIVEKQ